MKKYLVAIFLVLVGQVCGKQSKQVLDTSILDKMPAVGPAFISNDGSYLIYTIDHLPKESSTLVFQSVKGSWKKEIIGLPSAVFTNDSKKAFYMVGDSLISLTLGSDQKEVVLHVQSFRLFTMDGQEWLSYHLRNPLKELVVRNAITGRQLSFPGVNNYLISKNGHVLFLQGESRKDDVSVYSLRLVNLSSGGIKVIWEGAKTSNLAINEQETSLCFVVETGKKAREIWCYKEGQEKAILIANNQTKGIDSNLLIESISGWSRDGGRVFIKLKEKEFLKASPESVKVDLWSYKDAKLQSQQLIDVTKSRLFDAVIRISNQEVIRLLLDDDERMFYYAWNDSLAIVCTRKGAYGESHWNPVAKRSFTVISTLDGQKWPVDLDCFGGSGGLSPNGRYVVGRGDKNKNDFDYYCFDRQTGVTRNLTKHIEAKFDKVFDDALPIGKKFKYLNFIGWLGGGESILLYDRYDMWQVDISGRRFPVNLTNGYGQKHLIKLSLAAPITGLINLKDNTFLKALNLVNKDAGFYRLVPGEQKDPEKLKMGPDYILSFEKALNTNVYLTKIGSVSESPNWYSTSDFKTFNQISQLYPEKQWNWMTSELLTWKSFDAHPHQGILYKPENFDPTKRYPLIVHYYNKRSHELNIFYEPGTIRYNINIPWFVSHGYLVFVPDIFMKTGDPGQGVFNSVVSGVKMLQKIPYVNPQRIGIQGHSFGGWETNYLLTHTDIFAAGMASSGASDFVSGYGELDGYVGHSLQYMYEVSQSNMGATLWEKPEAYIRNSPIFSANRVATPLLMMNNKRDAIVRFAQGIEFFTALRRLGKKVWMLQYDDGDHLVPDGKDAMQHTIRMTQFFDHYLKDAPAPRWMTQGIPAKVKGVETGFELDPFGNCGTNCKVCQKVNADAGKGKVDFSTALFGMPTSLK